MNVSVIESLIGTGLSGLFGSPLIVAIFIIFLFLALCYRLRIDLGATAIIMTALIFFLSSPLVGFLPNFVWTGVLFLSGFVIGYGFLRVMGYL